MAVGSNFAFKIAAKLLQIETLLLLTSYKHSSSPYLTVPLPIPYNVAFSNNTCVTGKQRTDRHIKYAMVRPNGRPKNNKKFELMLARRAKAYSSSGSVV